MGNEKGERPPKDMAVPETMRIAALLAELMPPGAVTSQTAPISLQPEPTDPLDEAAGPGFSAPALQFEDLDDDESATTFAVAAQPPPLPASPTTGEFLGRYNWTHEPEPAEPQPAPPAPAAAANAVTPLDPELIPLGNLTASGYFMLMNWTNDPDKQRHPRRADVGLDEQTLSVARRNPFYVIGQPRRAESRSVGAVLAEIAWE